MYKEIINKNYFVIDQIWDYCINNSTTSSSDIKNIIKDTCANKQGANMLSSNIVHNILAMIIKIQKSKICVDIGTYTGLSAMIMAKFSDKDSIIYSIDLLNQNGLDIAEKHIYNNKYGRKINLIKKDAKIAIQDLPVNIDLIFIDADKRNIKLYFNMLIKKLSQKAIIIVDDVLWYGKILHNSNKSIVNAIQEFNHYIKIHPDFDNIILPVRNGLNIIYKNK